MRCNLCSRRVVVRLNNDDHLRFPRGISSGIGAAEIGSGSWRDRERL